MSGAGTLKHRPELDGVRGVACLLVLSLHCCIGLIHGSPGATWEIVQWRIEPFLSGGVDLFFVLSGLLISGILMDSRDNPAYFRRFWTRRFARIFPVYFLTIGLCAAVLLLQMAYPTAVGAKLAGQTSVFWPYMLFVQNIFLALTGQAGPPMLGVTWSLAIEEQFYIFLPLMVFLLPRRVITAGAFALFAATPLTRAYAWQWTQDSRAAYLLTFDRLDALSLGILLAALIRSPVALDRAKRVQPIVSYVAVALIVLQALGLWNRLGEPLQHIAGANYISLTLISAQFPMLNLAMAALLLNLFTASDGPLHRVLRNPILTRVGLVSYAAYVYHQTFNFGAFALIYGTNPRLSRWDQAFMPVLVLGLTFVAAALSYRWFEMPIRRWAGAIEFRTAVPALVRT